ncbi:hypothetical protein [Xanthobacter sediminis]
MTDTTSCPVSVLAEQLSSLYETDEMSSEIDTMEVLIRRSIPTTMGGALVQIAFIRDAVECLSTMPPSGEWRRAHQQHVRAINDLCTCLLRFLADDGAPALPEKFLAWHGLDAEGRDVTGREPLGYRA